MSRNIAFLLMPNTNILDLGGASQVFYEALDQGLDIEMEFVSTEQEIICSTGLPLGRIKSFKNLKLEEGDYLFIPSADYKYIFSPNFKPTRELLGWLQTLNEKGVVICAICTGAFLLGKAGLLDGRKCTTHWKRTIELQSSFPKAKVQHNILFIEDNSIYTSAGANSAIDVAIHVLSNLGGEFFAHKISRELVIYNRRNGMDHQISIYHNYRNHFHTGIHKVQDFLIVPKGIEHRPVAKNEVSVMLFEPASTLNTGNVTNKLTRVEVDRI